MIKKNIGKIFLKFSSLFKTLGQKLNPPPPPLVPIQAIRCEPWFADNGDSTHRLNYDLNQSSIVFDMGGYEGQWASDIFGKFMCSIYIFEPYGVYAKNISERFEKNSKIKVFDYGLSNKNEELLLKISNDGSSVFKGEGESVTISLKDAEAFFNENQISHIDLLKINIEGGEYDLLEAIINDKIILNVENIQVQFHDFVPNAEERMKNIQKALSKTHYTTYSYEFVWENWRLKK